MNTWRPVSRYSGRRSPRSDLRLAGCHLHRVPWCAALCDQIEVGLSRKRLRTEYPCPGPCAGSHELERYDRVDRGLPDDCLRPVLTHRPRVVDRVVQVDLAGVSVLAGSAHPCACTGDTTHPVAEPGRVRETRGDDVSRRDLRTPDLHRLGGV